MMLIDKKSGTLFFGENQHIRRRLKKTAFLSSILGRQAYVYRDNPPFVSYTCSFAASTAPKGVATLFFNDEKLNSVQLLLTPQPGEVSTIDWQSVEYQREMKVYYPQFLRDELGPPPYEYSWGSVAAGTDDRTGYIFSYIWIAYV